MHHPLLTEYLYMSLYVIDCKIWCLFPEMCLFQGITIHLLNIHNKKKKILALIYNVKALSLVKMTQQIIMIQQEMAGLRFPMLHLFSLTY